VLSIVLVTGILSSTSCAFFKSSGAGTCVTDAQGQLVNDGERALEAVILAAVTGGKPDWPAVVDLAIKDATSLGGCVLAHLAAQLQKEIFAQQQVIVVGPQMTPTSTRLVELETKLARVQAYKQVRGL
jgi:hypothetical protein